MSNASGLPRLYHVCQQRFEQVDIEVARTKLLFALDDPLADKSPKGAIGFWLSPMPDSCSGFGSEVAEAEIAPDAQIICMDVNQLRRAFWDQTKDLSPQESLWACAKLGDELSRVGDILLITDASEAVGEVIVLNERAIARLNWDCIDRALPLSEHQDEIVLIEKIAIDEEASRSIRSWHFLPDGTIEKSAIKRSPALR